MYSVTIKPEMLAAAAATTGMSPPAADEVSTFIAAQFAAHAYNCQVVIGQAAAIHEMFVAALRASAAPAAGAVVQPVGSRPASGSARLPGPDAGGGGTVSANMGRAASIGPLSVPQSWFAAARPEAPLPRRCTS
jgi:hypothetical protein